MLAQALRGLSLVIYFSFLAMSIPRNILTDVYGAVMH